MDKKIKVFLAILVSVIVLVYFFWMKKPGDNQKMSEQLEEPEVSQVMLESVQAVNSAKNKLTETNMRSLQRVIEASIAVEGKIPEDLRRIRQGNPPIGEVFDAWGTSIKYEKLSEDSFRLISAGKDKVFNTPDDIVLDY